MSREIKFRAWCPRTKSWVPERGFLVHPTTGIEYKVLYSNSVLMQYTGLQDRKGVEIYEGDVVGYRYEGNNSLIRQCVVKWNVSPTHAGWNIGAGRRGINWQVIGNVYEHPELLETAS